MKRLRLRRIFAAIGVLAAAGLTVVLIDGWQAFGAGTEGERHARVLRSPEWLDGHFENPQPMTNDAWGSITGLFRMSAAVSPVEPVPTATVPPQRFDTPPATGVRATWLGHSTVLVEVDGARVLTDPIWGERASPFDWSGPRRWYAAPIAIEQLPKIDAVLVSHDHYDHLDHRTIIALKDRDTKFVVPLGVGAHLGYWGVPEEKIIELDWWERAKVGGGLEIACAPARHASGRFLTDYGSKLWASYALIGSAHRVYYSGDTGLFPALREIGEKLGPFDLTMIEVGQYGSAWPDWHLGPEQAVVAHQMLRGRVMLPVHWGAFALAYHGWTEPIERSLLAAEKAGVKILVPKPGQSIEPENPPPFQRWWPKAEWKTADQDPIVSSLMD